MNDSQTGEQLAREPILLVLLHLVLNAIAILPARCRVTETSVSLCVSPGL
jgi:hypothetical protein